LDVLGAPEVEDPPRLLLLVVPLNEVLLPLFPLIEPKLKPPKPLLLLELLLPLFPPKLPPNPLLEVVVLPPKPLLEVLPENPCASVRAGNNKIAKLVSKIRPGRLLKLPMATSTTLRERIPK
jgi:hypothetical protein